MSLALIAGALVTSICRAHAETGTEGTPRAEAETRIEGTRAASEPVGRPGGAEMVAFSRELFKADLGGTAGEDNAAWKSGAMISEKRSTFSRPLEQTSVTSPSGGDGVTDTAGMAAEGAATVGTATEGGDG